MREIKFRAWDKGFKKMLQVSVIDWKNKWVYFEKEELVDSQPFGNIILLQYTGLKDKNGKEIYEGDLVKWGVNLPLLISFGWGDDAESYGESYGVLIGSSVFCGAHVDCEVIGNRFENKELLK